MSLKVRTSPYERCINALDSAPRKRDCIEYDLARVDVLRALVREEQADLLKACETLRKALEELSCRIDEEMDLDRDDKPNWAMRLGTEFSSRVCNAFNGADAALAKARVK